VKLLAIELDKSPFFGSIQQVLDSANAELTTFLSDERFYAPNWWIETWDENLESPITLLAEKGVKRFVAIIEVSGDTSELEDALALFLTDIVRVEWQFAQLVEEKPEHTESYVRMLRESYRQISDRMREEMPQLCWIARNSKQVLAETI
jgi:hypothetical protein